MRFNAQKNLPLSVIILILANMVPLFGVLLLDWQVFPLILFFWIENIIIGFFNFIKMLSCQGKDSSLKWFMSVFFLLHYGIFTIAHGFVLIALFGHGQTDGESIGLLFETIRAERVGLAIIGILLSHAFSLFSKYFGKEEYKSLTVRELMFQPYRRIVIMHVGLILGAFLIDAAGSPPAGLLVFIIVKIIMDIPLHIREHRRRNVRTA